MIENTGKYYLYRHIRLDKNEPFYIGIGTKGKYNSYENGYARSLSAWSRTKYWKNIVSKTKYEVEILLEPDDYEFIKQKEIEFIALYGRKNLDKGTLCNLTDGGEGSVGYKHTDASMIKMKNKIKKVGKENPASEPSINTITLEIYDSAKEASKVTGYSAQDMRRFMRGEHKNPTYFVYLKNYAGEIHYPEKVRLYNRRILNTQTGEIFTNAKEVSKTLNISHSYFISMLDINNKAINKTPFIYL